MQDVLDGVRRFQERRRQDPDLFRRLATQGQAPEVLFIGCSDSRVPPEVLISVQPGSLFVTRNVANIVPPYGTGEIAVGAVIEYAVLHLHVKRIVVCGHTDCGGIRALDKPVDWTHEPHIARWIEYARPAKTKVEAANLPEADWHLATVRENVLLQLQHLSSYDSVRDAQHAGTLALDAWVYNLDTGSIEVYAAATATWHDLFSTS